MDIERRISSRAPVHLYFNKYIDGHPHLCEAVELSMTGMLVRRIHEPDASRACYAVEIASPELETKGRLWMCASPVWQQGQFEALSFVGQSHFDRMRLADLLASTRAAA